MKSSGKRFVFAAALLVGVSAVSAVASHELVQIANATPPPADLDAGFSIDSIFEENGPEIAAVEMYTLNAAIPEAEESLERSVDAIVEVVNELMSTDQNSTDGEVQMITEAVLESEDSLERSVGSMVEVVHELLSKGKNTTDEEVPIVTTSISNILPEVEIVAISMHDKMHDKMSGLVGGLLEGPEDGPEDRPSGPDDLEAVTDFVIDQYSGRWYEQGSSIETQFFTAGCECTQATYTLVDNRGHRRTRSLRGHGKGKGKGACPEKYIEVKNECYRSNKHKEYTSITGSATPASPVVSTDPLTLEDARLQVQFFGKPSIPDADAEGNYWVVAVSTKIVDGVTVYDNAIVSGPPGENMIWFLTRDREVSDETFEQLQSAAITAGIAFDTVNEPAFTRTAQRPECDQLLSRKSRNRSN